MTEKEKYYRSVVTQFQENYGANENELLEVFRLKENGDNDALKRLCNKLKQPNLEHGYVHFAVAYRQLLRERKGKG